jgi:hypothetical protein
MLQQSGHQVTLVAKELRNVPKLFPAKHYRWLQAPETATATSPIAQPQSFADVAYNLGFDHEDKVLAVCGAWLENLRQQKPDLIIADFGVACLWIATALGIPAIRIGTGYSCPPQSAQSLSFVSESTNDSLTADTVLARAAAALHELGLSSDADWNDVLLTPDRTLLATVSPLDPFANSRTENEYSGPWDQNGQVNPQWSGIGRHRAIAYLKPFQGLPQLLASLHRLSVETVLYGDGIPRSLLDSMRNPLLKVSDAPLRLSNLTHSCDFVLCNGNHGTTSKALGQSIPVFAVPLFLEQRITAATVQREQWGVSAVPHRPDEFPRKLEHVLSTEIRKSVTDYPGRVARYANRGLEHAWQKLQAFLH